MHTCTFEIKPIYLWKLGDDVSTFWLDILRKVSSDLQIIWAAEQGSGKIWAVETAKLCCLKLQHYYSLYWKIRAEGDTKLTSIDNQLKWYF